MTGTIILPRRLEGDTFRMVSNQVPRSTLRIPDRIDVDFCNLQFVSPVGVTFLSNMINWFNHNGCDVRLIYDDENRAALRYLDDSLFFEQHAGEKLKTISSPRLTTMPLLSITHNKSHAWLDLRLMPGCNLVPSFEVDYFCAHGLHLGRGRSPRRLSAAEFEGSRSRMDRRDPSYVQGLRFQAAVAARRFSCASMSWPTRQPYLRSPTRMGARSACCLYSRRQWGTLTPQNSAAFAESRTLLRPRSEGRLTKAKRSQRRGCKRVHEA